jgi:hypothetical protein
MVIYTLAAEYRQMAKTWQNAHKIPLFMHYPNEHAMYNCVMLVSARFFRVASGLKGTYRPLNTNKTERKLAKNTQKRG